LQSVDKSGKEGKRMTKERHYTPPIVLRVHFNELRHRWKARFVLANLFYLVVIGGLAGSLIQNERKIESISSQSAEAAPFQSRGLETLKTKETIYSILRGTGISLNQGLDIAEVLTTQSKSSGVPISLILAVMKKESQFTPHAVSSQNAMGLMQVHPVTWNEYVNKLKLNVSSQAAFDPVTNVFVATHILRDLYDSYKETASSDSDLWEFVLAAYYGGKNSIVQNGISPSHKKYVADVNRFKYEFAQKLMD
jgi:soluble lytic murein transglycosylase-like protein